jgi:kinetochore protein Nuf2
MNSHFPQLSRAKIADEEPKRLQLKEENDALRAKMLATKDFQMTAAQEVERLKIAKNALIKRRVGSCHPRLRRLRC